MPSISDAQLAVMRSQVETMLPDTAVIQSKSLASDGAGGWNETWSAVTGGTVSCRMDPLRLREAIRLVGEQERLRELYQLTTPHDAPLDVDYRVVVGGETYSVIQLDTDHSWNVSVRAVVAKVE